ncbi:MAG: fumarate hydratase [Deltaproteobacteria bacterium]|nr:fumarate hydratase [Deltaproteobacteria bacterium]
MKTIGFDDIVKKVKAACMSANFELGEDVITAFKKTKETEESPVGKEILEQLIENATIAKEEKIAMCQDTGFAVFFVEIGDEVKVSGGNLVEAINEGVRQGYKEGYLRKSICHPFTRKNTGDNTPAIVHLDMVPGDQLKIIVAPKGGGSENMSRVTMLKPSDGIEGIKRFVVERVRESGANPCPPLVIGVGIGGTFEKAALIAKKALLRPVGSKNPDPELVSLEEELLVEINDLGVGPQGLGGRTTALAVHVNMHPCHIASLPVAVNINCHASRHKEIVL